MANSEKDEVPMLSETSAQRSELVDSNFRRPVSRTRSASMSIPMVSMEPCDREASLVGHTGPLRRVRKTSSPHMSGPLHPTHGTGNLLQHSIDVTENKVVESRTESFSTFRGTVETHWNNNNDRKNEHLLRSGQLGMCNDPYCTTCPTYFKAAQQGNSRTSNRFDPKFHNVLYGDAKGLARKVFSFCSSCVPGVMNPHTKVVQQWNNILAIFCLVAIFLDPLFFFLLYVQKERKCIVMNWAMEKTLVLFRSLNDLVYFLNILLQFRLAYVSPESTVVGAGDLVDHPKKIALHYLRGYFLLDLFVVIPLPQIIILFVLPNYLGSSGANYAKNLLRVAILVQYIPRLFRFLPLLIGQSPTGFIFESAWGNFIINLLIFMLSGHVVGSCWYLFGLQRVNQCLRDACRNSNITAACTEFIDCGHGHLSKHTLDLLQNRTSDLWSWANNANATACLNSASGAFAYGIYANAVPLTIETNVFHNVLHGYAKLFARKVLSFCSSYVPGVMNPHAKLIQQWNKIVAIICLGAICVDPLFFFLLYVQKDNKCIIINRTMRSTLVLFRSLNDLVYFLNILLQFRLAYVAPESRVVGAGELVDDPKKIALRYLRGYFLFDLFVVIPLPQIMLYFVPNYLGSSRTNYAENLLLVAIPVQFIFRLFRFFPLLIGQSPTPGFIFKSVSGNFVITLFIFLLSGHVVGSFWYLFGLQRVYQCLRDACHNANITECMKFIDCGHGRLSNETSDLWNKNVNATACLSSSSGAFAYGIYANAVPLTIQTKVVKKYLYALFWGFQQISTLAGNQTPSDFEWEVLFTMAIVGLGLLQLAVLIGNIQSFLQGLGRRTLEMQLRERDVEQWMSHCRLPEDLRRRVRQAEQYNWAATRGVNAEMLMENMPEDLQRDIRRHLFKFIKKVRIFALMDEPILDAICERLRQKIYIYRSSILYRGGLVDKMVFVVRGKLESIGEDGTRVSLSEGDACGEELLRWYLEHSSVSTDGRKVRLPGPRLLSSRTVRCLTNVEAFSLRAADLEEVTILFTRFLRSPRVQGALRYESPHWRSLAATQIQVAWRNRKKRLNRATSQSVQT